MKTEFLKELGLEKEAIDKIMAENGKDIEAEKAKLTAKEAEIAGVKKQLDDANKQIEDFKGLDVEGIKKAADDYKTKFEEAEKNHKAELDKIAYNATAEKFIDSLKPKDGLSKSAILSEFAKKEFKLDGDSFQGAKEWAEQFKKDNAAHFTDTEDKGKVVSTGGAHGDGLSGDDDKFLAAAMAGAGLKTDK